MKLFSQISIVAVLAGAVAGAYVYREQLFLGGGSKKYEVHSSVVSDQVIPVEVTPAVKEAVSTTVEVAGIARAYEAVTVTTSVQGIVTRVAFEEGQWVEHGTILAELYAGSTLAEREEIRAELNISKSLYERAKKLKEKGGIATSRLEELAATVEINQARLEAREIKLAEYFIKAPFSGHLGLRRISVGALIKPGDSITTLDDTTRIKVDFRVPEVSLSAIEVGQSVEVRSVAYPEQAFLGSVETIDSRIDPITGSIEIRTLLSNENGWLKPGMYLTAKLIVSSRVEAILVPEEAIINNTEGQHVFAAIDGIAVLFPVDLGVHVGGRVEITGGIVAGVPVITGGIQKIREGSQVHIISASEDTSKGEGA